MQRHQTNTALPFPCRSTITKTDYRVAVYCRLSKDDGKVTDSSSIQTQRDMLTRYVREQDWIIGDYYIDDGYSGLTFERPEFKRMIADIEVGKIDLVITKDLSRLGRNYLETGVYIEVYFPERGIRYIALNDGVDTLNSTNTEITPFKNILNEMYAKDISRKVKSAFRVRFAEGQFIGSIAPYGYVKDPNDHHRLIIDEPAAKVVRRIFDLALSGMGLARISKALAQEGLARPGASPKNGNSYERFFIGNRMHETYWSINSVRSILRNPVYAGHIVAFKRIFPSLKSSRSIAVRQEDWPMVRNVHEPIIDQESYDLVQKLITSRRSEDTRWGENIFAGLLKCADCGYTMRRSRAHRAEKEDLLANLGYACNQYTQFGRERCTYHWVEARELYDAVLTDIRMHAKEAVKDGDAFTKQIIDRMRSKQKEGSQELSRELRKARNRLAELDRLFLALYEDRALGSIDERNYQLLSGKYQAEQQMLDKKISFAEQALKEADQSNSDVRSWISTIRQYIDTMELTAPMLHELVEKIVVSERKTENGQQTQEITIHYRFVGNLS